MDYQRYFEIAIAIFNENVGSDFTVDNVVLDYLTSDNQNRCLSDSVLSISLTA